MPELPANFTSSISTNASQMMTNLAPYATLIIGVMLGAIVLGYLISILTGGRK